MKDIKFFQDLNCENDVRMHSTLTSPPARQISYKFNDYNSTATAYWSTLLSYTDNEFMRCCHRHGVAQYFHVRQGQLTINQQIDKQKYQKSFTKFLYSHLKQKFLHFYSLNKNFYSTVFLCLLSFILLPNIPFCIMLKNVFQDKSKTFLELNA